MLCEFVRSFAPRRPLCWLCARLDIRDIRFAKRAEVSYTCGLHIRAPHVNRCRYFGRELGTDDRSQPRGRSRVAGVAR
jgi:hypothetical protein